MLRFGMFALLALLILNQVSTTNLKQPQETTAAPGAKPPAAAVTESTDSEESSAIYTAELSTSSDESL
ncbi:hypothetical protein M514_04308 [Trichuris suis]|uniref:Uncharacterized protein n=1 Tax=Trichuris suis TaxID=68888 RepID=A0A085MCC8_9BILA|nr:hypothetical protein M513_04308 [Trichuris suis]KFD71749.1 hypothetical protein M514_04308 [Trichuris suis]